MPFLGTTPTQGFVSSVNKQSFTPNGVLTSFTLSHPVANANDLEVFVGNVRQEPTAAYSAAGTTLDFGTGNAPPNGVNFYVIYKNQAQVTTTPPDGSVNTTKITNDAITTGKILNDAVTLDKANDNFYKTGTFSVLFRDGSGSSGNDSQTFANQTYTKIGNVVHINVYCQDIDTSGMGASSDLYMHGLPFNPSKSAYSTVWLQNVNNADLNTGYVFSPVFFVATAGGNHGYFSVIRDNADARTLDVSEFADDSADIALQMSYHTNE